MNSGSVMATNVIAGSVLESLKAGLVMKGVVLSYTSENSIGTAWISIELAGIGNRQVAVHCEHNVPAGLEVEIQCVPNPLNPGHYMFRLVNEAPST